MEENRKKTAAMAAVFFYLAAEEEAARHEEAAAAAQPLRAPEGFWSYSGRQSQMMLRGMAEMRLFRTWKS